MRLHLGTDSHGDAFSLPVDIATEKLAFIGRTGSGKTYGATKLAETLLEAGVQIVALDPVGVWRGLRVGASFPVYIFGGLSGDFPLEPTAGALVADLIVDRGISAVLDVSQFETDTEKARFAAAFADRFFFRKKAAPSAVHVFIEEAQEFIPQNPQKGEERMLHAFQRIWKIGRNFGIGGTIITQRPQEVNKKALNQAGTLFVFQLTGPQEREAVGNWVADKGISAGDVKAMLPLIKVGEPHVWSPYLGEGATVRIGRKQSADVSSTPKVGAAAKPQALTPIDAEKLRADMAATVERAKENDPSLLKAEIRRLTADLARKPAASAPERIEVRVPDREVLTRLQDRLDEVDASLSAIRDPLSSQLEKLERIRTDIGMTAAVISRELNTFAGRGGATPSGVPNRNDTGQAPRESVSPRPIARAARPQTASAGNLPKAERLILTCLAQFGSCSKSKVAAIAGYAVNGGGFNNSLSALRARGFISAGEPIDILPDGVYALGAYEALPAGPELIRYWLGKLPKAERSILECLSDVYPQPLSKEAIAKATGYEASGGGFNNALGALRTLELITRGAEIKASDNLFSQ